MISTNNLFTVNKTTIKIISDKIPHPISQKMNDLIVIPKPSRQHQNSSDIFDVSPKISMILGMVVLTK